MCINIAICFHEIDNDCFQIARSLAARFLFMPVEESFYIFFSQTLSREGENGGRAGHSEADLAVASNVLSVLLKAMSLVALTVLSFGQSYAYLLLDLYGMSSLCAMLFCVLFIRLHDHYSSGGETLSAHPGPFLLQCYCVYVLFLAINGISECFMMVSVESTSVCHDHCCIVSLLQYLCLFSNGTRVCTCTGICRSRNLRSFQ